MLIAFRYLCNTKSFSSVNYAPKMFLLIPVLNEQSIIEMTFHRFESFASSRPWLTIVFITSCKEDIGKHHPTTHQLLTSYSLRSQLDNIRIFKYPHINGVMAHQLNYAVDILLQQESSPFIIGVFNADSITSKAAIDYAYTRLSKDPAIILQQYAVYPPEETNDIQGRILSHIAAWQTRWSLHFELGRLLVDRYIATKLYFCPLFWNILRPLHYSIGHGLFLDSTTFEWATGFAEDEINEDAQFGFLLQLFRRRLEPIPFLEIVDSPPTLSIYLKQQAVWFNGPLYAFQYARKLLHGSSNRHLNRPIATNVLERLILAISAGKLFLHAIYWLLGPPALLVTTIFILLNCEWMSWVVWTILVLYFVFGLNVLGHQIARRISTSYATNFNLSRDPIAALVAYLFHCIGPVICLTKFAFGKNITNTKYKTERREAAK